MPRNTDLSSRNILRAKPLEHPSSRVTGPLGFLNPTSAQIHGDHLDLTAVETHSKEEEDVAERADPGKHHNHHHGKPRAAFNWSSRNNRKGRHGLVITKSLDASSTPTPPASSSFVAISKNIRRMCTEFPYWDVSWLVAVIFTIGSVVWVFNGCFVWLPVQAPSSMFPNEILYGGGITAFIGATIFEFGSVLLMIEAVNENRSDCFGWALEEAFEGRNEAHERNAKANSEGFAIRPTDCKHHHANHSNFVGKGPMRENSTGTASSLSSHEDMAKGRTKEEQAADQKRDSWRWFPSWKEFTTHYIRDIGFLACSSQMFGATIFWIAGFTALPGIYGYLVPQRVLNGAYWIPQIIGGSGFVVSGFLFMLETQKKWWLPAPTVLGWHIGLYNLIGGIGFTLSPIFGLYTSSWAQYEAALTTFWASWFFLIGSLVQWYESQEKNPVTIGEVEAPASTSSGASDTTAV